MADILIGVINTLIKGLAGVVQVVIAILPTSPFQNIQLESIPHLASLNWVFPIDFMISTTTGWLVAMGIYYLVQTVLRWGKVIE